MLTRHENGAGATPTCGRRRGGGGAPISYDRRRRRQQYVGGAVAAAHSSEPNKTMAKFYSYNYNQ